MYVKQIMFNINLISVILISKFCFISSCVGCEKYFFVWMISPMSSLTLLLFLMIVTKKVILSISFVYLLYLEGNLLLSVFNLLTFSFVLVVYSKEALCVMRLERVNIYIKVFKRQRLKWIFHFEFYCFCFCF